MSEFQRLFCGSSAVLMTLVLFTPPIQSALASEVGEPCSTDADCGTGLACVAEVCAEEIVVTAPRPSPPRVRPFFPPNTAPPNYSNIPTFPDLTFPSNPYDQDDDGTIDCWSSLTGDNSAGITSGVGYRTHPITGKKNDYHNGIDIAVSTGTIVQAAQSGTIVEIEDGHSIGKGTGNGNFVRINYDDGTQGVYLHLWTVSVSGGDRVSPGRIIATSDDTGNSTRPHLHYSIWREHDHDGDSKDPDNFYDPAQRYSGACA